MLSNYELQQNFLDIIKEFSISNPNKEIDRIFIYSLLKGFNIENTQEAYQNVSNYFNYWYDRYKNNGNINVFQDPSKLQFLGFSNGKINGNEIKLYIPLDINHLKQGADQLFDFISTTNIEYQGKIANMIRNDNLVIRVNSMEDAKTIITYVYNNKYLKEGMLKVNPFLPTCNGVGITMDNSYSFNSVLCSLICNFLNYLKQYNRLDLFNVSEFNKFVKSNINNISDLDLKDIYVLISKTTDPNFKLQDFVSHANYKLCDKYNNDRKRIIDSKFYFENAIKVTNQVHPQNTKEAILSYLKGNANYFTNQQKVRDGLVKYVNPGDIINLMRSKLSENNIKIPGNDNELVEQYLNVLLNKEIKKETDISFEILKNAYINTLNAYNIDQARHALKLLITIGDISYFTNQAKDRNKIKEFVLGKDVMKIILSNINLENLNINEIDEIINRFDELINSNEKELQNMY